ncbi:MAG: stage II sporulation protein M [Brachybacterium sp.]|nr:stage II sporulation protein M [Brachybacterium sp.]
MDTDAFIAVNRPAWDRLAALLRIRHLDAAQIDDLIDLHQRTAGHLSTVRSTAPDPVLIARLSMLLARSRTRILGSRPPAWARVRAFWWEDLPAALYSARWPSAVSAAVLIGSALLVGLVLVAEPTARAALVDEDAQRQLVEEDFVSYYFQSSASGFAAQVWSNNAWIAAQAVVLGVTGFWPIMMLLVNGANLGVAGGVMAAYGGLGTFFVFILPHGLLEVTCVIVGAGAGLRMFWAWARPGPVPRSWALARAGRSLVTVAIGLIPVLAIAGVVEAFVTPSGLPPAVRIGIGVLVWAGFLALMLVRGRTVARAGISGDLSEEEVGDRVAVAA